MWRTIQPLPAGRSTLFEEGPADDPTPGDSDVDDTAVLPGSEPGELAAPDLIGAALHDAKRMARLADLHVLVDERPSESTFRGRVVSQDPEPGARLRPGDSLSLIVGSKPHVVVPDVRGLDEAESLGLLRDAGLLPARRIVRPSNSVPQGYVIRTRPKTAASVPIGSRIAYVVAGPPRPRGGHGRREARRARSQPFPDGIFLTLPEHD